MQHGTLLPEDVDGAECRLEKSRSRWMKRTSRQLMCGLAPLAPRRYAHQHPSPPAPSSMKLREPLKSLRCTFLRLMHLDGCSAWCISAAVPVSVSVRVSTCSKWTESETGEETPSEGNASCYAQPLSVP